jgi:hypothetical protein
LGEVDEQGLALIYHFSCINGFVGLADDVAQADVGDEGADQLVTGMMAARQICPELSYNSTIPLL